MASLQYLFDTICANFTEESMFRLLRERINQGQFTVDEILPLLQNKDGSLDTGSARMLAEAALEELARRGEIRKEGDNIYPAE